jgi:hypothetical protein
MMVAKWASDDPDFCKIRYYVYILLVRNQSKPFEITSLASGRTGVRL